MNADPPGAPDRPDTPVEHASAPEERPEQSKPSEQPGPSEQSELDLGVISTGSADIDRALQPLQGLGAVPVAEHPDVFESVLGELAEAMTDGSGDEGRPRD